MSTYDVAFFYLEGAVASESATVVMPAILRLTGAETVVDVGGGTGAWAYAAQTQGCTVRLVDGHVPDDLVLVDDFVRADLAEGYDCSGFDLAVCLEVAEHLEPDSGPALIAGLAQATSVLFSAATPGQPGVGHINCRPHDYWHELFDAHGMTGRMIGSDFSEPVADFYRRNMVLYSCLL